MLKVYTVRLLIYLYKAISDSMENFKIMNCFEVTTHVSLKQMRCWQSYTLDKKCSIKIDHAYQVWNDMDLQWKSYAPDKEIRAMTLLTPPPLTKVIPICRLSFQATQKWSCQTNIFIIKLHMLFFVFTKSSTNI